MKSINYIDKDNKNINISVIGFFKVEEFNKEYIMYGVVDDDKNNTMGNILLGEVIRDNNNIKVLGILEDEIDLVLNCYNEINKQVGV